MKMNPVNQCTRCYYCLCAIQHDMTIFMSHDKTFCSDYHRSLVVHAQNYSEQPSSVALASMVPNSNTVPTNINNKEQPTEIALSSVSVDVSKTKIKKRSTIDKLIAKLNLC